MRLRRPTVLFFAALLANADTSAYQIHDLTSIANGAGYGYDSRSVDFSGLNNRGTVTGSGSGLGGFFTMKSGSLQSHQLIPYTYDPSDPLVQPPQTFEIAFDINDRGQVLGAANFNYATWGAFSDSRGFIWSAGSSGTVGTFEWLSSKIGGAYPLAISNTGRVVGWGSSAGNAPVSQLKTTVVDSSWTPLAPLPGDLHTRPVLPNGRGDRIVNDSGQIIGVSCSRFCTSSSDRHAVVWSGDVGQALPGGQYYASPLAINKAGDIAGVVDDRAVLWKGNRLEELGSLTGFGGSFDRANAINDNGHVVGQASSFNAEYGVSAFIWKNGQMTDLNTLYELPEGFWATSAGSINNRGQIIVDGLRTLDDGSGEQRKFLISPEQMPRVPVVQSGTAGVAFSTRAALVPSASVIGRISASTSNFQLTRPNGEQIAYQAGEMPQVRLGDKITINTGGGGVRVSFNDNSIFDIAENSSITLDEYVFDPNPSPTQNNVGLLRSIFVFTSGLIGREDRINQGGQTSGLGYLGIRGDAADYIRPDLLDVAVKMNVGSPVSLSTFVQMPGAPFALSFDYVFLTGTGTLDVYFEDLRVGSFAAMLGDAGRFRQAQLLINDPDVLAMPDARLSFIFDGPTGAQMLIDDVVMPGLQVGGFNAFDTGWYKDGPGNLELVATISESAFAQITAVPEPETWAMLVAGLLIVVARGRRREEGGRGIHSC